LKEIVFVFTFTCIFLLEQYAKIIDFYIINSFCKISSIHHVNVLTVSGKDLRNRKDYVDSMFF